VRFLLPISGKGGRLVDRDFTPKAIREKITEESPSWWPKK